MAGKEDLKRLHELTDEQVHEWRMARLEYGRQKYGDRHLKRYNLVDLMEELLDALNIVEFVNERAGHVPKMALIEKTIKDLILALPIVDKHIKDEHCTDEEGGERIWWSKQK